MNPARPIVLIEDDADDVSIIRTAIEMLELSHPLVVYPSAAGVPDFLLDPALFPLLVISDVNLPGVQGVELYRRLMAVPSFREKRIPYVFLSTSPEYASRTADLSGCGYFVKPRDYFEYVGIVQRIVLYWYKAESGIGR